MRLSRPKKLQTCFVCLLLLVIFVAANVAAQEGTKVSGKMTATYTGMDSIVVGDVPGHILSLSTAEGTNASTGKNSFMDGAQLLDMSFGDLVQGNGTDRGYARFTMDGDMVIAKYEGKVTTVMDADDNPTTSFEGTWAYTKGTGKFKNITGEGTYSGKMTSKRGFSVEWYGFYSMGK
jgi:hypothetical protein